MSESLSNDRLVAQDLLLISLLALGFPYLCQRRINISELCDDSIELEDLLADAIHILHRAYDTMLFLAFRNRTSSLKVQMWICSPKARAL